MLVHCLSQFWHSKGTGLVPILNKLNHLNSSYLIASNIRLRIFTPFRLIEPI